jgi:hypothetical protein
VILIRRNSTIFLFPWPHPLERGRTFRDLRTGLGPLRFLSIFALAAIRNLAPTFEQPGVASETKEWVVFPTPSSDSLQGSHRRSLPFHANSYFVSAERVCS